MAPKPKTARTRKTRTTTASTAAKAPALTAAASSTSGGNGAGEFACPECGRSFQRAAALGAHRRRAHNVAGKTTQTRSRSTRTRTATNTAAAASSRRPRASARRATATTSAGRGVNRNALLKALFPNGIPANEEAIRSVNSWLDEAERLARLK